MNDTTKHLFYEYSLCFRSKVFVKKGHGEIGILVVPPVSVGTVGGLLSQLPQQWFKQFTLYTFKSVPKQEKCIDMSSILDACYDVLDKEDIKVIYADTRRSNIIKSILVNKYTALKGPSVDSIAISNHKYYVHALLDSCKNGLPKHIISLDGDVYDTSVDVLRTIPIPQFIRPCLGGGNTKYMAANKDQLIQDLQSSRKDTKNILQQSKFLEQHWNETDYPYLLKPVVLISPYVDFIKIGKGSSWRSICVEAAVYNGEIIPWATCDYVFLPRDSSAPNHFFQGLEMPSQLQKSDHEALWTRFKSDIENMIKYGFDNSFVHAEYLVFQDGFIELASIKGFVQAKCTPLYAHGLKNGNNIDASMQLANGIRPKTPEPSGRSALIHLMTIVHQGKADALVNFSAASTDPSVVLRYTTKDDIVFEPATSSAKIGSIAVGGESFEGCLKKIKVIRKKILKIPEFLLFVG